MRNIILLVALFLLVFPHGEECRAAESEWVKVRYVNDGDTITLTDGGRIRYIGIDAPEIDHKDRKAQPFGFEARRLNSEQVLAETVRLEFDRERKDRYGRILAYVFLRDNSFVNARIVAEGYAYCYPHKPNIAHHSALLEHQRSAMSAKKGIWGIIAKNGKEPRIGNRKSKRFHHGTCRFGKKIGKRNRVLFSDDWDAYWAGFAPGRCLRGI